MTGSISGVQTLTCSRTLEPFDRPFTTEVVIEVTRTQVAQQELDEDDVDVFAYQIPQGQSFVDVSECVRQLVILQEPVAPVKNPRRIPEPRPDNNCNVRGKIRRTVNGVGDKCL